VLVFMFSKRGTKYMYIKIMAHTTSKMHRPALEAANRPRPGPVVSPPTHSNSIKDFFKRRGSWKYRRTRVASSMAFLLGAHEY
jgi:hypothetical protein